MEEIILTLMFGVACWILGDIFGFERGYKSRVKQEQLENKLNKYD